MMRLTLIKRSQLKEVSLFELSPYRVLGYPVAKEVVERILRMPKRGKMLSYKLAREMQILECIGRGKVDFTPAAQDIVQWAIEHGFYIEFAEGELEF